MTLAMRSASYIFVAGGRQPPCRALLHDLPPFSSLKAIRDILPSSWHKVVKAMKKESAFQAALIKELKGLYPGCVILKNDPNYIQGFPDLTILYKDKWAALECKRSEEESHQPNQDYYVNKLGKMSYSSFIFPENKETILNELEQAFKS